MDHFQVDEDEVNAIGGEKEHESYYSNKSLNQSEKDLLQR